MHIALSTHSFYPRKGGVETVLLNLSRSLSKEGHQVSIFVNHYPPSLPSREQINGVDVYRLPLSLGTECMRDTLASLRNITFELGRLILFLKKYSPDILNVHFISLGHALLSTLAARFLKLPVVATAHGSDLTYLPQKFQLYRFIARRVLQNAQVTTFSCDFIKDTSFQLFGKNKGVVQTIRNGVDISLFNNEEHYGDYILAIGRIEFEKGFDYLLHAYKKLITIGRTERLLIAGEGTQKDKYEKLVVNLNLQRMVCFLGCVEEYRITDLIKDCKFLVISSLREGFPVVCLEAMATGKAIVATRVGGIPEIINDGVNGFLVEPKDPQALADVMLKLLRNDEICRQMGKNGRKLVEKQYTWKKITNRYLEVYHEAIKQYHF